MTTKPPSGGLAGQVLAWPALLCPVHEKTGLKFAPPGRQKAGETDNILANQNGESSISK